MIEHVLFCRIGEIERLMGEAGDAKLIIGAMSTLWRWMATVPETDVWMRGDLSWVSDDDLASEAWQCWRTCPRAENVILELQRAS